MWPRILLGLYILGYRSKFIRPELDIRYSQGVPDFVAQGTLKAWQGVLRVTGSVPNLYQKWLFSPDFKHYIGFLYISRQKLHKNEVLGFLEAQGGPGTPCCSDFRVLHAVRAVHLTPVTFPSTKHHQRHLFTSPEIKFE